MVRLKFFVELNYGIVGYPADFIFNIHATRTQCQSLVCENLSLSQDVPVALVHRRGTRQSLCAAKRAARRVECAL